MVFEFVKRGLELAKHNWGNPLFYRSLFFVFFLRPFYKIFKKPKGKSILDEEWDHLIILDACRYDNFKYIFFKYFSSKINMDYTLKQKISLGSHTREFLKKNFSGRYANDIIYVTATPMVDAFAEGKLFNCTPGKFFKIISVWKSEWNEDIGTVMPQSITEYAMKAHNRYPDKRLIVHYIQPHYPFILDPEINVVNDLRYVVEYRDKESTISDNMTKKIFDGIYFMSKYIDESAFWRAYNNNLKLVLEEALKLARQLKGKIVITSDHGESYKKRIWCPIPMTISGHPEGIYIDDLVVVPWLEIYNGIRDPTQYEEIVKIKKAVAKTTKKLKPSGSS